MRKSTGLLFGKRFVCTAALLLAFCGGIADKVQAFTFEKIADTNTPIPGGVGNFTLFNSVIADGSGVWFIGSGIDLYECSFCALNHQSGIYHAQSNSSLATVFEKRSDPRFRNSLIGYFVGLSVDQGDMAFGFAHHGPSQLRYVVNGIFGEVGGTDVYKTAIDHGVVVFKNPGAYASILKNDQGAVSVLVDGANTPIPNGTGTFTHFYRVALDGNNLAFYGNDMYFSLDDGVFYETQRGVYKQINDTLSKVADLNTAIPNGTGFFTDFGDIWVDDQRVLFVGEGASNQIGLFLQKSDSSLEALVTEQTAIPEATGTFSGFGNLGLDTPKISLDDDLVVFQGNGEGVEGIYSLQNGVLLKIIDSNDTLDGKPIVGLSFIGEGLDGGSLAFTAQFTDGSQGVYLTAIPEPATALLLTVGSLLIPQRRRARV